MSEEKVSLLVTRPAPLGLPDLFEWNQVNGRNVRGKRLQKGVLLKPGPNRAVVSRGYWDQVKPKCKKMIDAGILVEITAEENVPAKFDPGQQIKFQSVDDAKIAIAECSDLELLQAWHNADGREEVQEAVKARLRDLIEAQNPAAGSDSGSADGADAD